MKREEEMDIVDSGTTVNAPFNSANSCMKNPPSAGTKKIAEILQSADFFTRSLKNNKKVISTEKKNSLHFKNIKINKESNKERKKEEESKE